MTTLSLLLVGLFSAFCIARVNRSVRVFGISMLSLALGFVGGASASEIYHSLEKKDTLTLISANVGNGESISTVWVVETPSARRTTTSSYPSILSKIYFHSDILSPTATPQVKTVHPTRCLSPPIYIVSSTYLLAEAFDDDS